MIQTVPYATTAPTTAEIMARYRPIAPKPEDPGNDNSALPDGIAKSPYLRGIWNYLQARPTRSRKRGRPAAFPPGYVRRTKAHQPPPFLHPSMITAPPPILQLSADHPGIAGKGIDLNTAAAAEEEESESDNHHHPSVLPAVISPKPIRPVRSMIIITSLTFHAATVPVPVPSVAKTAEEVEAALEGEAAPAIASDSKNKVRLANSAYREMVGQPECGWLGGKRIGGEVILIIDVAGRDWEEVVRQFGAAAAAGVGFEWRAKIEWEDEREGGKKKSVNACGKGEKVECRVRDYIFFWRFSKSN